MSSIFALINDINNGEVVLPAIQRDFVWDEGRIEKLFDSMFRGYPIGIVLLWETYEPIQFRTFERDYKPGKIHHFKENKKSHRLRLVLDGQQRLSSINIALNGSFGGKLFFVDILSGRDADDTSEDKFRFKFAKIKEVDAENDLAKSQAGTKRSQNTVKAKHTSYWLQVSDLVQASPKEAAKLRASIINDLKLDEDSKLLLEENIAQVRYSLTEGAECLKTQTIDANLPAESPSRKTIFDILEIFVRINSQSVRLSRSDLIVSMLRLYWPEASDLMPTFIEEINSKSGISIDTDFVIRCLFAVAGIGTRLDFDLLRKKTNVDAVKAAYDDCMSAIRSVIDFIRTECRIDSVRLLSGVNTMIPLVYYISKRKSKVFLLAERDNIKKTVFLFAFSRVFSQHIDSRTGSFIRDFISTKPTEFPYEDAIRYVGWKTGFQAADERLFGANRELSLALTQGKSDAKINLSGNLPEIDHIFPKSVMLEQYDPAMVHDIGNLWFLQQVPNRNKGATHPKDFFKDVPKNVLKSALIDYDALDYRRFRKFVENRRSAIVSRVKEVTGLEDADFDRIWTSNDEEDDD